MRKSLDYIFQKKQKDFYETLNNINTLALAKIIEINNQKLEASIQLIAKSEFKSSYREEGNVYTVPIVPIFNSTIFFINAPYQVGDLVIVGFCQHSLEGTIDMKEQTEPLSKDQYSQNDAIILGNITAQYINKFPEDFSIVHKNTGNHIRILSTGNVEIKANTKIIGNLEVTGTGKFGGLLESAADVQSNSISLVNHKHGNVQSGGSDSGVPK